MRMGFILSFLFLLLMAGVIFGQDIVYCFPAPGDNVVGLGSSIGRVWAIDATTLQIYELDQSGSILNQYPVVGTTIPTGLAWGDSVLYYADGGTAIVHAMSDGGSYLGSFDFSDSGIISIRGLGFNNDYIYPNNLLIADDSLEVAYAAYPPLAFDTLEIIADLADAPDNFYDAAISTGYGAIYLACGNHDYNVQTFDLYGLSNLWDMYEIGMIVGIADYIDLPTDEFLWLSDPVADSIYLVYYGLGIEESSGSFSDLKLETSPNPFFNSVTVSVQGLNESTFNLQIFDLSGRLITELEPFFDNGEAVYFWNGRSASGVELPDGIFTAKLSSGDISYVVMLLKL
jgi:hypothetical protein